MCGNHTIQHLLAKGLQASVIIVWVTNVLNNLYNVTTSQKTKNDQEERYISKNISHGRGDIVLDSQQ